MHRLRWRGKQACMYMEWAREPDPLVSAASASFASVNARMGYRPPGGSRLAPARASVSFGMNALLPLGSIADERAARSRTRAAAGRRVDTGL